MLENHLKNFASKYEFSYNHLAKTLSVDLSSPFVCEILENDRLKVSGKLPSIPEDEKENIYLQMMQLNLALSSKQHLSLGLNVNDEPMLISDFVYELDAKEFFEEIETFANHLDKISAMLQDLTKAK